MDELQEMREQMAALKEKLNKQEIVNDKLLRRAVRRELISQKIAGWLGIALFAGLGMALWYVNLALFDGDFTFSVWFILLNLLMICSVLIFVLPMRLLKVKDIRTGTLLDIAKRMRSMSDFYIDDRGRILRLVMILLFTLYVIFIGIEGGEFLDGNIVLQVLYIAIMVDVLVDWILYFFPKLRGRMIDKVRSFKRKRANVWDEYIRQIEEITDNEKEDKVEEEKE